MATCTVGRDGLLAGKIMRWFDERYDNTRRTIHGRSLRTSIVVAAGNLCLGEDSPKNEYVIQALPIFRKALAEKAMDKNGEACDALSNIALYTKIVHSMYDQDFHTDLVRLLTKHNARNHSNALSVLSKMVTNTQKESHLKKLVRDCPELFDVLQTYLVSVERSGYASASGIHSTTTATTTSSSSSSSSENISVNVASQERYNEMAALRIVCPLSNLPPEVGVTQLLQDSGIFTEVLRIHDDASPALTPDDTEARELVVRTFAHALFVAPDKLLVEVMELGGARVLAQALVDLADDAGTIGLIMCGMKEAEKTGSESTWKKLVIQFHGHNAWESVKELRKHSDLEIRKLVVDVETILLRVAREC